ncbi:L domain-like protein [Sporormia fimetaria CBS 119925]|uniref:L domain-like protein n=1 Tax=Sporormia fimetaria CBS 119925 TaxID=1340428 RepID=A0A6A6V852_9PLEO|nr:L domain-like protein [Sporormia fimetaria CBS 119925]
MSTVSGDIDLDSIEQRLMEFGPAATVPGSTFKYVGQRVGGIGDILITRFCQDAQRIFLNKNYLIALPRSFATCQNLRNLCLSRNELESVPPPILQLTGLVVLTLSHNKITRIPNAIVRLQNLEALAVSYNRLISLPRALGMMSQLQIVIGTKCRLNAHYQPHFLSHGDVST